MANSAVRRAFAATRGTLRCVTGLGILSLVSCASYGDAPAGGVAGGGGILIGGAPGVGGAVVVGGAPSTGGAAVVVGGATSAGGAVAMGGAPGAGGTVIVGGAPGTGGALVGGAPGTGGAAPGAGGTPVVLPPGTQQYTFAMDSFEAAPGAEFYKCQDAPNPFGADIAIVRTQSTISRGVHHMYAFQIPADQAAFNPTPAGFPAPTPPFTPDGKKTPIFDCPGGGFEFHPYFHLTQRGDDTISYPEKTGRSLKAAEAIRFNVHYLNTGVTPITIAASVVVDYVKPTDVAQLAAGIFVFAATLQVPTGASTMTFSYPVPQDMSFLQVTGHMHRRGTHYEAHVKGASGDVRPLYSNDSWDEPPTLNFAPPFSLKQGDVIEYSCTYNNDTGATLTYGESAQSNEMCNLFGVFFPAADGNILLGPV